MKIKCKIKTVSGPAKSLGLNDQDEQWNWGGVETNAIASWFYDEDADTIIIHIINAPELIEIQYDIEAFEDIWK